MVEHAPITVFESQRLQNERVWASKSWANNKTGNQAGQTRKHEHQSATTPMGSNLTDGVENKKE